MVRQLPEREKDKLLLRLIAKDALLLEQLSFLHLEHGETTEERVDELREYFGERVGDVSWDLSPGELMMQIRYCSGYLTRHVRVTKNKLGEVQLMVELLHLALDTHLPRMRKRYHNPSRWAKLAPYVVKRIPTLLKKAEKLHPDLWVEFEAQLNDMLLLVHDTPELNWAAERENLPRSVTNPRSIN